MATTPKAADHFTALKAALDLGGWTGQPNYNTHIEQRQRAYQALARLEATVEKLGSALVTCRDALAAAHQEDEHGFHNEMAEAQAALEAAGLDEDGVL
jgi:cell division septum initiation protein DivIVA